MKIFYHPEARAEYDAAVDRYAAVSARLAFAFVTEVEAIEARIAEMPRQFPTWELDPNFRKAVLPETFPHIVFFEEIDADAVLITAVSHGARARLLASPALSTPPRGKVSRCGLPHARRVRATRSRREGGDAWRACRGPTLVQCIAVPVDNVGGTTRLGDSPEHLTDAKLPPEEQDRIGRWLLAELADERDWGRRFHAAEDALLDSS